MSEATVDKALDAFELFVGEWTMIPGFLPNPAEAPGARTTFEWLTGKRFLVQRWEVDHPDARTASPSSASIRPRGPASSTTSTLAVSGANTR